MPKELIHKHFTRQVKELDSKEGIVVAYANYYNNEDSDGDISLPGSFKRTVNNNLHKIRVFKDHKRDVILGVPMQIDADDQTGLLTTTKFNMNKEVSRDMFTDIQLMMEHGQEADLSVGVIPVQRDDNDRRKVKEWKLKEYSFLSSWGANSMATVQQIKSDEEVGIIKILSNCESIDEMIDMLTKAYDLPYSDERLREIEKTYKIFEKKIKALSPAKPHADSSDTLTELYNLILE